MEFQKYLHSLDVTLYQKFLLRKHKHEAHFDSEFAIDLAWILEGFVAKLFNVGDEMADIISKQSQWKPIFYVKRQFVERIVNKSFKIRDIQDSWSEAIIFNNQTQFATDILPLIHANTPESSDVDPIEAFKKYTAWAIFTDSGRKKHKNDILFQIPQKINQHKLFDFLKSDNKITAPETINRGGSFDITNKPKSESETLWHTQYCIFCHKQSKDYCRIGFSDQKSGCPLDQKISEMNLLKSEGSIIGSLAIAMVDNPLLILTGDRICNDCEKACIYQKQDHVAIQSIETKILMDVLNLPYGFEIYSLLTRWNPLSSNRNPLHNHIPEINKILICGAGPAGIAMSYYMLQSGCEVYLVDGLKINPDMHATYKNTLIKDVSTILDRPLSERVPNGFGGVMEYGITVRWNKNFLDLAQILLSRYSTFHLMGGIRFGSTITVDDAFYKFGFNHIALCTGSGNPIIPKIKNIENLLGKTVYTASDFLMTLHEGGEFLKQHNTHNYQNLESPIAVIGSGLTAVDVACEAKALHKLRTGLDSEVMILCRNGMHESKAYTINDTELKKCLEEGISLIEHASPTEFITDSNGNLNGILCSDGTLVNARTAIIATGIGINSSSLHGITKNTENSDVLHHITPNGRAISVFGDMNKKYSGSVVKAIASAKNHYQEILDAIRHEVTDVKITTLDCDIAKYWQNPIIEKITTIGHHFVQISINAPLQAMNAKIGHIFRLTQYGTNFKAIPVTTTNISNNVLTFIIHKSGNGTDDIANLKIGQKVSLMGPSGVPINFTKYNTILLDHISHKIFSNTFHQLKLQHNLQFNIRSINWGFNLGKHKKEKILIISKKYFDLYCAKHDNCTKVKTTKSGRNLIARASKKVFDAILPNKFTRLHKEITKSGCNKIDIFMFSSMHCMLQGVCSRCLTFRRDGTYFYACSDQIIPIMHDPNSAPK